MVKTFERRVIRTVEILENHEGWKEEYLTGLALESNRAGDIDLPEGRPSYKQATVRISEITTGWKPE